MTDCDCTGGCEAGWDRFQPATRELMVFTKAKDRYFDLDSVRERGEPGPNDAPVIRTSNKKPQRPTRPDGSKDASLDAFMGLPTYKDRLRYGSPAGAPPLDWWLIPYTDPSPTSKEPSNMTATFYVGDAIEVMGRLPEKSVDLILSSPPFLALRSYLPADHESKHLEGGSQATPGEYVDWLLDVVEACARVLAPHGSLCFELGDTYSGSGGAGGDYDPGGWREGQEAFKGSALRHIDAEYERVQDDAKHTSSIRNLHGKKQPGGPAWPLAKSLSLIPESFRWAMVYGHNPFTGRRTEPWRLRNVIRWVRPNPPVGALGDKFRPATSELMVFCKAKDRYFDLDAVREPHKTTLPDGSKAPRAYYSNFQMPSESRGRLDYRRGDDDPGQPYAGPPNPAGAPPLDWWNIPPGGYPGAHYAVWPPELLVKPIKAMCPESVCRRCGEPRRRIVSEPEYVVTRTGEPASYFDLRDGLDNPGVKAGSTAAKRSDGASDNSLTRRVQTLGFSDCGHDDYRPGICLDPFAGSGTTLAVATGHGRDAIGVDLDERNYELALDRVGPLILELGLLPET